MPIETVQWEDMLLQMNDTDNELSILKTYFRRGKIFQAKLHKVRAGKVRDLK